MDRPGLLLPIMIAAKATRLMPHGIAAEMATPQQVYFRLSAGIRGPMQAARRFPPPLSIDDIGVVKDLLL